MSHNDPNSPWYDYVSISQGFQSMTVPRILDLLKIVNAEMFVAMKTSQGLKAEICSRLVAWLQHWKTTNDVSKWTKFKEIYSRFERAGRYGASPLAAQSAFNHSPYGAASGSVAKPAAAAYPAYGNNYAWQQPGASGSGGILPPAKKPVVKWKESPLFKVVESVTDMVFLKESQSQNDRQAAVGPFTLTDDVRRRVERSLLSPNVAPRLSLRLFCTSSTYYNLQGATHAGLGGLPIEFPQTSEVRVNQSLIAANLKGMKKKPGSCPPADLQKGKAGESRLVKMGHSDLNKVELVHVNSLGPQFVKRYWMQVCLIESTTPAELVTKVQRQPRKSRADVVAGMQQDAEDAEIQIGALTLNLKCPLSYVRMSTPVRSTSCDHLQCFEASSWFQINEQTPQWACPICERVLTVDKLFIDEFTEEIIKACPDSVDEVLVEPDGLWHSSNKKYGSAAWLATHPIAVSQPGSVPGSRTSTPLAEASSKGKNKEIFTLSSDDDDDDGGSRPPPSRATSRAASRRSVPVAMEGPIDLTLSSDEEEARPVGRPAAQRSSSSVGASYSGGANGSGGSLKRPNDGDVGGSDKRPRYDTNGFSSPLPVPTGATNGSSTSDASRVMLETLRAQAFASSAVRPSSSSAAPSSNLPSYNDPSQGGLRGGASSSFSTRDPRTEHPSFHPSSSYRRRDDDRDDGSGIASTSTTSYPYASSSSSSSSTSTSNYRLPPRDTSTDKYVSTHHHRSPQLSPPSSSSDTVSTPPPILPQPSTSSLLRPQLPPLPPAPLPYGQLGSFNNEHQPDFFGAAGGVGGGWNGAAKMASYLGAGVLQREQGGGVEVPAVWAPEAWFR